MHVVFCDESGVKYRSGQIRATDRIHSNKLAMMTDQRVFGSRDSFVKNAGRGANTRIGLVADSKRLGHFADELRRSRSL
jgi:hypothetical protein